MLELCGWVPLIPLFGSAILILANRSVPKPLIPWIGAGSVGLAAVLAFAIGYEFLNAATLSFRLVLGSWIALDGLSVPFGLRLDALSVTMMLIVTGVGFLIHLYSVQFMETDASYAKFFAYMNLFVAAMLVLVLADNLALLYLGWEGVGLCSYLLIGFWYQDPEHGYAARKAFVMTRAGDMSLALGLFLLFSQLHTFDIQSLMYRAEQQWEPATVLPVVAAALLLGGAVGKSAQLPLHTWLIDAMAGPTPISALIHAATMVTAGVYLIARTHILFTLAPSVQFAVAMIGAAGLFMAGCSALVQTDIKRILAYSTFSQIGYMFLALGVGAWSAAIFHLLTHAFFKALLFLSAGVVIYCFHHEHNIFKMGGLRKSMPTAFWGFIIGSAALTALPFTSGFYSKDEILAAAYQVSPALWLAGCLGALITGIYSFRLVFIVFWGPETDRPDQVPDWRMRVPLLVLGALALFGGMVLQAPLTARLNTMLPEFAGTDSVTAVSVVNWAMPLLGLAIAILFYLTRTFSAARLAESAWGRPCRQFLFNGWGIDKLYVLLLVMPYQTISQLNKNDMIDGFFQVVVRLSRGLHYLGSATQNGRLRWYASSMAAGAVIFVAIGLLS